MSYHISPDVFFLIEGDQVLLWNCLTHEQFLLSSDYFTQLLSLSKNSPTTDHSILQKLLDAGVIAVNADDSSPWGWDILSRLFHVGTRNVPSIELTTDADFYAKSYLLECESVQSDTPNFFQEKNTAIIDLPPPSLAFNDIAFSTVLKKRKTSRKFNGASISVQELSDFLYASFGLIHGDWDELADSGLRIIGVRKSSPSSGGIHAEEAYITVFNVEGLSPGLYYYRPQDHKLNLLRLGYFETQVISLNKNQFFSAGLAFGVYISARLDKYWWKYKHSRTYRVMLLDIGHVSQTALLVATALGFNTWLTGAFLDNEVESFLGLDERQENVFLYLGVGHGNSLAFPEQFLTIK